MTDHHFLSYSSADALEFACWLFDQLSDLRPPCSIWLDKRCLKPGRDWDAQIAEALERCRTVLFVMTHDSVEELSVCKQEWSQALKYKKPVIPLLVHQGAHPPFRLQDRQYLDFSGDRGEALGKLAAHLAWIETPAGHLQEVKNLLADAQRDLRRRPEGPASVRIQEEIAEYKKQIAHWQRTVENPQEAARRVDESIARGLELERQPNQPVAGVQQSRLINPPPGIAPGYFQDREVETRLIVDFLRDESKRVITVVGRGGVGKTALVCRLLKALEKGLLPHEDQQFSLDGIVCLSAAGLRRVSLPNLFEDLCRLLPPQKSEALVRLLRESQAAAGTKMLALLEAFPQGRTVVLLDNFENLVEDATREMNDSELRVGLKALLTAPPHGVKVILTTRLAPRDLALAAPGCQSRIDLDEGLPEPFAENILRAMDVDAKVGLRDAPAAVLAEARVRTRGYPRALAIDGHH
jgi:hypothetical protein